MAEFQCTYQHSCGIVKSIIDKWKLKFPEAYIKWEEMAQLSMALKEYEGTPFCRLPFCHTVEAEAMGGSIRYGDSAAGPRVKKCILTEPLEFLDLPEMDFSKGRIYESLLALRYLRERGEHVVFQISGPITILTQLINAAQIYRVIRKRPELMKRILSRMKKEILLFVKEAQHYGADMISYADASGGPDILGPEMAKQIAEWFTADFLKCAEKLLDRRTLLLLCPKTSNTLIQINRADTYDINVPAGISYAEGCIHMIGQAAFAGQSCINNAGYKLEDGCMKAVRLKG